MLKVRFVPAQVAVTDTSSLTMDARLQRAYAAAVRELGEPVHGEYLLLRIHPSWEVEMDVAVGASKLAHVQTCRYSRCELNETIWTKERCTG